MKNRLVALAALAFAASTSMATATENPFAKDKAILNLQGLDLSTADGQQRLAVRIDQAARAVCGDRLANIHLELEVRTRECRTAVAADVRAQIETRLARATVKSGTRVAALR